MNKVYPFLFGVFMYVGASAWATNFGFPFWEFLLVSFLIIMGTGSIDKARRM